MKTAHELKTWPQYFEQVINGNKKFELRQDDRNYKVGHHLILKEFDKNQNKYTGREHTVLITYILRDAPNFGLKHGYCLMSID